MPQIINGPNKHPSPWRFSSFSYITKPIGWLRNKDQTLTHGTKFCPHHPNLFFFFFFVRLKCNFHPLRFRVGLLIFKIYKNNSYNNIKVSIPLYLLYFCHNPLIIFFFSSKTTSCMQGWLKAFWDLRR